MHTFKIVLGDPSHDGHGRTETFNLKSYSTKEEIGDAYAAGVKKLGFDILDYCDEYEDCSIPIKGWEALKEANFTPKSWVDAPDEEYIGMNTDLFVEIILFTVWKGNPAIEIELLGNKEQPTLFTGGYGLFFS